MHSLRDCQYEDAVGVRSSGPRADNNSDDNTGDKCCLNHVTYTTIRGLTCLFTRSARSWQCGGQGFESP
jgi:hypothetical protein